MLKPDINSYLMHTLLTNLDLTGHPTYLFSIAPLQGISVCDITGFRFATAAQN